MKTILILLAGAALVATAGCAPAKPSPNPQFGDAVRHNMAVQIINPDYRADPAPVPLDGARAGVAIDKYRSAVPPVIKQERTSDMGSSGS